MTEFSMLAHIHFVHAIYFRAMLCRARYCYGKLSVCL